MGGSWSAGSPLRLLAMTASWIPRSFDRLVMSDRSRGRPDGLEFFNQQPRWKGITKGGLEEDSSRRGWRGRWSRPWGMALALVRMDDFSCEKYGLVVRVLAGLRSAAPASGGVNFFHPCERGEVEADDLVVGVDRLSGEQRRGSLLLRLVTACVYCCVGDLLPERTCSQSFELEPVTRWTRITSKQSWSGISVVGGSKRMGVCSVREQGLHGSEDVSSTSGSKRADDTAVSQVVEGGCESTWIVLGPPLRRWMVIRRQYKYLTGSVRMSRSARPLTANNARIRSTILICSTTTPISLSSTPCNLILSRRSALSRSMGSNAPALDTFTLTEPTCLDWRELRRAIFESLQSNRG